MIQGIELASTGLDAYTNVQEVIARNLANANTVGFKKNTISFETVLTQIEGVETSSLETHYGIDYSKGDLTHTGNALDIAIDGDGFFTLETGNGMRYTRNGQFQLSSTGEIVTSTGSKVLGKDGPSGLGSPIQIPNGSKEIVIDIKGNVKVDGNEIGKLMITHFNGSDLLVPTGDSTFTAPLEAISMGGAASFTVAQGYLEGSNVSVVTEMVDMIANMRSYEATNNVIKTYSDLMEQLIANQSNIA